jgi:hypothetical protein
MKYKIKDIILKYNVARTASDAFSKAFIYFTKNQGIQEEIVFLNVFKRTKIQI